MLILRTLIFSILSISLLAISSCKTDPCADVSCEQGVCVDGTCDCETGYEGENCDLEIRERFYGEFEGQLIYNTDTFNTVIILKEYEGSPTRIKIEDYYLEVTGANSFDFPAQDVANNWSGAVIEGYGNVDGNRLQLWYTVGDSFAVNNAYFDGYK